MNSDFESPPFRFSVLASVGGVVTAVAAIALLRYLSGQLFKTHTVLNSQAMATSISQTPSPISSEAQKAIEKEVEQKAAVCKFDSKITPNRGMTLEVKSFLSSAMGQQRTYGLILPPGYHQNPQKSYPVIFLLHGGHGDTGGWQACGAVTEVLHKLYSSGKLPHAIVITPDGNDKRGSSPYWDSQYFDGPNGQVGTLIGTELVREVKSRYRVFNDPQFWAMGGLSSGGWGAFNIGLRYLNNFNILFSHSGYFTDISGSANSPNDVIKNLSPEQRSLLRVYLDAGVKDAKYLDATEQFHQRLVRLGIVHTFNVFPGGHGTGEDTQWRYWHKHLEDSLSYVGEQWKSTPANKNPAI